MNNYKLEKQQRWETPSWLLFELCLRNEDGERVSLILNDGTKTPPWPATRWLLAFHFCLLSLIHAQQPLMTPIWDSHICITVSTWYWKSLQETLCRPISPMTDIGSYEIKNLIRDKNWDQASYFFIALGRKIKEESHSSLSCCRSASSIRGVAGSSPCCNSWTRCNSSEMFDPSGDSVLCVYPRNRS